MKYEYIAVNQKGEEIDGILEAESKDEAVTKLRGAGLFPTQVAPEGESDSVKEENKENEGDKSPTPEELAEKQAAEAEFVYLLESLSKIFDFKILNEQITDGKKALILGTLVSLGEIAQNHSTEEGLLEFSPETFSKINNTVNSNKILNCFTLIGGIQVLTQIIREA